MVQIVLFVLGVIVGLVMLNAAINKVACVLASIVCENNHINSTGIPCNRFPRNPLPYTNGSERGDWGNGYE